MHRKEKIRTLELTNVTYECREITSLWFMDEETRKAEPGQYLMIWVPGLDEVPMSISGIEINGKSRITVRVVGETTEELADLQQGDRIGVRGPFGNSYNVDKNRPLIVAGGSGAASLMPLVLKMIDIRVKPTFILGARSKDQLLFVGELEKLLGENLVISTDDGSKGYSGYASELAAKLIETNAYDMVYTCGPERMMEKVFQATEEYGLNIQASLERYVKCAVGLCGSCAIGPYRVCADGPIFDNKMLRKVREEFGISTMDPSGRLVRLDH